MNYKQNLARPFLSIEDLDKDLPYVIVNFDEQGQVIYDYLIQNGFSVSGFVCQYRVDSLSEEQIVKLANTTGFIITRSNYAPSFGETLKKLMSFGVTKLLDPEWFFALKRKNTDYYHIFKWAEQLTESKDGVVLDVGANKGFTSLALKSFGSQVIAFEPAPPVFEELKTNVSMNKSVRCEQLACSDTAGFASFYLDLTEGSYGSSLLSDFQTKEAFTEVKVKTITLDEYCQSNKIVPTFIKIDVEGFEYSVIKGMKNLIEQYTPPLVFEFWHNGWNRENRSMFEYLSNHYQLLDCEYEFDAYSFFSLRGDWLAEHQAKGSSNIVCIPKQRVKKV